MADRRSQARYAAFPRPQRKAGFRPQAVLGSVRTGQDSRPGSESGGHPQAGRTRTDRRCSRAAAHVRNSALRRGSHSANGTSCDASQFDRSHDDDLHRSQALRHSRGRRVTAKPGPADRTSESAESATSSDRNRCNERPRRCTNGCTNRLHFWCNGVISCRLIDGGRCFDQGAERFQRRRETQEKTFVR